MVLGAGAVRRVVGEGDQPAHPARGERLLQPLLVLRSLEEAVHALVAVVLGRVDADELEVAAVGQPVEEPGLDRRTAALAVEPLPQVEVVLQLRAVVAALGVGGVVVADRREERHAGQGVAVGLEEARVPVVVLASALVVDPALLPLVDVVAQRHHEPDVALLDELSRTSAMRRCRRLDSASERIPTP